MESSLAIKASSGKTVTEEKDEPQPSTSYPSNENINEELFLSDTLLENEKMYKRRSGTTDSGRDYEYKMLTLLCIRCILKNPEDMWLATNAMHVGDFDDIILNMKTKGNPRKTYMMQIKHKDLPSEITDADFMRQGKFDLIKHTQSFSKLEKTLVNTIRSGDIIENLDPDKIVSVFFTNRIAANSGIPYFEKSINPDLTLLNTRAKNKHLYKFNSITGRALDLTNWDYCRNIYFLSNQVNETDADVCILEEMQKLIKQLGLIKINSRKIAKDFTEYVTKWAKCKSKDMQYLTKKQVLYKLTDLFISKYAVKLKNEPCAFYDCPTKNIWNRIVHDKIITYVAFDIMAFTFLKEYIGSEVRKYHFTLENKWINNLSDENKKLFFDKNSNLKRPMLNITGEIGTLTMLDVYKCLWLNNKIPLLLEINSKKDHQNILNILEWSKLYLKIIIVNKVDLMLSTSLRAKTNFFNLNDLNEENRKLILEQSVSLQGRKGHKLGELVNESMFKCIKCKDIICILLENYNIGNVYSLTDKYFIERSVYRTLIKFEALEVIKDEVFIIHNETPKELLINKLDSLNLEYSENIIVSQDITKENIEELKSKYNTIHRLIFYEENWLEWVESRGKTEYIKEHLVHTNNVHSTIRFHDKICEDVLKNNVLNKTHIFSGCPGMGKSTLTDFISNKVPSNMWVLKITLNDHTEHYETAQSKKSSDHIKYFGEKIINDGSCINIPLAIAVFRKLFTEYKILVFLDGFDEVSVSYKEETTKMMKSLHESGYHTWIFTRSHMNSHLEEEFDTIAVTITPFTLQDQHNFFIKYFTEFIQNPTKYKTLIDEFIEKLLKASEKNLNVWDLEFMGIPLQCKLLADYFIDDLNASLSRNIISSIEDFNLLQLYEHFMNKKRNILCKKHGKCAEDILTFFDYHQKLVALKILFRKRDLCELDIDLELNDYYQNKKNCMEILQREGILVVHEKEQMFSATFVHRTFAEFIAAQWLVENYDSKNSKIKNTIEYLLSMRFRSSYLDRFLFRIFDSLFAKEFPLHSAIINKQITQIKEILTRSPEDINKFDKCKRSILHLIAVYFDTNTNTNYHHTDHKVVNNSTAIALEIIETIPIRQMIDLCGKDDFGYNPLDYAFLCCCPPIVDKLYEKSNEIMVTLDISRYEDFVVNNRDNEFEFKLNERFQYLGWKCIERDLNDHVSVLLDDGTNTNSKYRFYLVDLNVIRITDLIEKFKIKSTSENYYFDLRFAAAFGTIYNVKQLLAKGADVNQRIFGYTPLFCAVQKNRLEIVEILLPEILDVNATCVYGNTALHAASEAGYENLVEILIRNGANINKRNKFDETPLFLASRKSYLNIVNLLLQHKADINIINSDDSTCLHVAAEMGFHKLIHKFIQLGMDVNTSNVYGKTPLFLALENGQTDVASLLIKQDIKVDITDYFDNNSYLHAAAAAGQIDITRLLIEKGLDINKQNKHLKTPLFYALKNGHSNVAKFLFANKAKVGSVNISNNLCLYFAAKLGESCIVRYMIKEGFNINFENVYADGETPLSVAIGNGHISVVELLLKSNAKIDGVDRFGNTCLHVAAKADQTHIMRQLINAGLDINKQNRLGETPLLTALRYSCLDVAKTLISCGADFNLRAKLNSNLHYAAQSACLEDWIQFLLRNNYINTNDRKCDLTVINELYQTLLHISVYEIYPKSIAKLQHHKKTVNFLLTSGIDVNKKDFKERTVLHYISDYNNVIGNSFTDDFYEDVATLMLNTNIDINAEDVSRQTALDLATKNRHYKIAFLILQKILQH